ACCRLLLRKVRAHFWAERAVGVAERFADGTVSLAELEEAHGPAPADWQSRIRSETGDVPPGALMATRGAHGTASHACWNAAETEFGPAIADCCAGNAAWAVVEHEAVPSPAFNAWLACEQAIQCDRLRDIFGNPFRPPLSLPPAVMEWNGGTVQMLAQAAYDE